MTVDHIKALASLEAKIARLEAVAASSALLTSEREDRNKERFAAIRAAVDTALASADRATSKAEAATEKRFEGVNEFRATLSDQATHLLPRGEYAAQHAALSDRLGALDDRVSRLTVELSQLAARGAGKSEGLGIAGTLAVSGIAFVASLVAIFEAIDLIMRR